MSSENIEICPVCQVKIKNDSEVIFSAGKPGDRTKLWARVCQYVAERQDGCINQDSAKISVIKSTDSYQPVRFEQRE
ncbi:MAG: hypothetical protein AAGF83_22090 [Cyanobacteria bacterium P01_G01_bin.67]